MSFFQFPARIICSGPSGCGKSNLAVYLMCNTFPDFDEVYVFCTSLYSEGNAPLFAHVQDRYPHAEFLEEYDPDLMSNILYRQQQRTNAGLNKSVLIFCDDQAGDASFSRGRMGSSPLELMAMRGRHFGITLMLLTQTIVLIPKNVRAQSDLIAFATTKGKELDAIYDMCGFKTKGEFVRALQLIWNEKFRPFISVQYPEQAYYCGFDRFEVSLSEDVSESILCSSTNAAIQQRSETAETVRSSRTTLSRSGSSSGEEFSTAEYGTTSESESDEDWSDPE